MYFSVSAGLERTTVEDIATVVERASVDCLVAEEMPRYLTPSNLKSELS